MRARRFRPFRLGLWLGVVGAVVWFLQRQRSHEEVAAATPEPARWTPPAKVEPEPVLAAEPVVEPAPPPPAPEPDPEPVIVAPQVVEVGDLDEPSAPAIEEPAPAPVKKVAPKKAPAKKAAARKSAPPAASPAPAPTWVAPEGGTCPTSHPVKAKLSSKLFHLPGMFAYNRTNPDRCYADEASAEADGLKKAKR
jgi:hypothetical protein